MKRAMFIKDVSQKFTGEVRLYKVSPPVGYDNDWETGESKQETDYIVVYAVTVPITGPETYILPANENGDILDWGELLGSFEGGMDHEKALIDGGFVIRKMRIRKFLKKYFSYGKGE